MSAKFTFLNLLFASTVMAAIAGCNAKDNSSDKSQDTTAATLALEEQSAVGTEKFEEFDWSTVPESSSIIGDFPYLMAPAGFYIQDKGGSNESKTGYSEFKDFNKLIMYNGKSFYNAEGKVAKLKFQMKEKESDWNQYKFDSSVDKYLNSIGAKLLGKLKVNETQKTFLNKEDDMAIYNHIIGDPYNEPVRFYALNHAKGKMMFQIFSNSASGEVAVIELQKFEQTIKAPTTLEIRKEVNDKS